MSSARSQGTISVAAILAESAHRIGNRTAIILGETEISYQQLWLETRAVAGVLRARGIGRGDRVALLMPNVPDFVRAYYGILALGATVVPVHALLKADEIKYILKDSGATLFMVASPLLGEGGPAALATGVEVLTVLEPEKSSFARLEDELPAATPIDTYERMAPEATATILYTSGTTGTPKGALGSHFALVEQTNVLLLGTFDLRLGDVVLGTLPLFHTFGQTCVLNAGFRAGVTIVLMPKFEGPAALELMSKHSVDVFYGVPTMYVGLIEAMKAHPTTVSLRYAVSGGASLPVAVIERFREVYDAEIYEGYGLTETSPAASFNHVGHPPKPGCVGTPIWGVDIEIADPEVHDRVVLLAQGEQGEVVIRGHNLFQGYHNRPEATDEAVVDGWFRTGDIGIKDEDGHLRIVDRTKDMILRNGYNVYPREVEEVLAVHPDVVTSAVFGIPHEEHGQEIAAAVVRREGADVTEAQLIEFVKERIAAYKYPRILTFVDALPLNSSGKVLKRELSAKYAV